MVQPLWKIVWSFLKKLKIELPYDPAIPLLDIYLEKILIKMIHANKKEKLHTCKMINAPQYS